MIKALLTLCICTPILFACSKPVEKSHDSASAPVTATTPATETTTEGQITPVGDTTDVSLDWNGDYEGILPCADCEGIKTELELKSDKTYELSEEYLGKTGGKKLEVKGTFTFDSTNPSIIILDQSADARKFFVGENKLYARDQTGAEFTGELAEKHVLMKK